MFPIRLHRDPIYSALHDYNRLQREMDQLMCPVLHHALRPRVVIPHHHGDKFEVKVDVQNFAPEELNVKMVDKHVVIEGKHEEKQDDHGYISRQFVRRYAIPEDVNPESINCNLSSDGVLMISAPRMIEQQKQNEKALPINFTGQPAIQKSSGDDGEQKENNAQNGTAKASS